MTLEVSDETAESMRAAFESVSGVGPATSDELMQALAAADVSLSDGGDNARAVEKLVGFVELGNLRAARSVVAEMD